MKDSYTDENGWSAEVSTQNGAVKWTLTHQEYPVEDLLLTEQHASAFRAKLLTRAKNYRDSNGADSNPFRHRDQQFAKDCEGFADLLTRALDVIAAPEVA